jgi:hypothetical protein
VQPKWYLLTRRNFTRLAYYALLGLEEFYFSIENIGQQGLWCEPLSSVFLRWLRHRIFLIRDKDRAGEHSACRFLGVGLESDGDLFLPMCDLLGYRIRFFKKLARSVVIQRHGCQPLTVYNDVELATSAVAEHRYFAALVIY